jgi:hypothetical protein
LGRLRNIVDEKAQFSGLELRKAKLEGLLRFADAEDRDSSKEAFEGLELGEGKLSRPVLRGPGGRKAAWLLGLIRSARPSGV